MNRVLLLLFSGAAVAGVAWWSADGPPPLAADGWSEVQARVWRSNGSPAAYALIDEEGERALLIDAPASADLIALRKAGIKKIERVLLTHHHRDTCSQADWLCDAEVPVLAPKAAAAWLTPESVAKYWKEQFPLRSSNTAYFVVPVGIKGIECSLEPGQTLEWSGWKLEVIAAPGHSRDQVAYLATKEKRDSILFCGDAMAAPGKLWSPFSTDWDHWTDAGLKPAAATLRSLAKRKPAIVCPAHGEPIHKDAADALNKSADAIEEVAFLKSFERFTKDRLGKPPTYAFLAKEQKESSGEKPWSQLSEHLYLTGNTYVLVSKDNALLVVDPWGKRSVEQLEKLRKDKKLGAVEVVMFSHAHYDHYDGVYDMPDRDKFQVWALDLVARPIAEPLRYRAPFLDVRPVKFDKTFKDGETAKWREYAFDFHHLPGQSYFTMGVVTHIDGKKCIFTADNWFHQDQFSGSGGWMGLNRSWPLLYASSAKKVLNARPDWVLAEHGGAFEFNAADFERRVQWAEKCAEAADALSPSGNHRQDWDPNRVAVTPQVAAAKPGDALDFQVQIDHHLKAEQTLRFELAGRKLAKDVRHEVRVKAGTNHWTLRLELSKAIPPGRHVFPLRILFTDGHEIGVDAVIVVDVEK